MLASTRRNSFIKQVMDQVKKDMEADDKLRKDWEQVQKSSDRMRETSAANSEKLEQFGERMKSLSSQTSELLSSWSDKARNVASSTSSRLDRATEDNEALKKAREFVRSASESTSAASSSFLNKTREKFSNVMDASSRAVDYLGDENKKAEKTKQWKKSRDAMAEAEKSKAEQSEATDTSESASMDKAKDAKAAEAEEVQSALVVSQAGSSSWGPRLSDMPFLNSVFENPLFDRVFGETEIAASIREMKELDYTFRLEEFAEDLEYIVAPHIIKSYLEGDEEALQKHCGEACFSTVNAGIKERKKQQMSLDSKILAGPREVELKGAKLMEQGAPCFIWTFNMQQVNCLRDSDGEIIEGAVDDIRTVCYAMAVTRHPQLDKLDLEYPWQVSELAILWNQPSL
ncbi:Mitochondrial import inner membrane translocase subunit tim44 [Durusdinium trenchii]|uniref:Mitochondrial import inner membrane translocase subunit tim44 n=2 Tax=Durusdinium trenchii TaxID=1381693 RepID=A0ABP0QE27_9DINO